MCCERGIFQLFATNMASPRANKEVVKTLRLSCQLSRTTCIFPRTIQHAFMSTQTSITMYLKKMLMFKSSSEHALHGSRWINCAGTPPKLWGEQHWIVRCGRQRTVQADRSTIPFTSLNIISAPSITYCIDTNTEHVQDSLSTSSWSSIYTRCDCASVHYIRRQLRARAYHNEQFLQSTHWMLALYSQFRRAKIVLLAGNLRHEASTLGYKLSHCRFVSRYPIEARKGLNRKGTNVSFVAFKKV